MVNYILKKLMVVRNWPPGTLHIPVLKKILLAIINQRFLDFLSLVVFLAWP
jgi:hypothetical protein